MLAARLVSVGAFAQGARMSVKMYTVIPVLPPHFTPRPPTPTPDLRHCSRKLARATLYSAYYSSHSLSNARVRRMEVTKGKRSAVKPSLHLVFVYRVRHNSSHSCGDVPEGALPRQDQELTPRKHPPISSYLFIEPL